MGLSIRPDFFVCRTPLQKYCMLTEKIVPSTRKRARTGREGRKVQSNNASRHSAAPSHGSPPTNRVQCMYLAALQVLYSTGSLTEMLDALDSRHPPTRAMATACMDIVLEFDR